MDPSFLGSSLGASVFLPMTHDEIGFMDFTLDCCGISRRSTAPSEVTRLDKDGTVPEADKDSVCEKPLRPLGLQAQNIISCLRVGPSLPSTESKQQEQDESRRGAHRSGALVIYPAKTTSQQCAHQWGFLSEAILQMSLLCALPLSLD